MASVRLKASVFHDGRYRRAGHILDVPQAEADRLVGLGVAEAVGAGLETASIAPPETAMKVSGRPRQIQSIGKRS